MREQIQITKVQSGSMLKRANHMTNVWQIQCTMLERRIHQI